MNREELLVGLKNAENIFSRFENAYNIVLSLPSQKMSVYKKIEPSESTNTIAKKGTYLVGYVIAAVLLLIPTIVLDSWLSSRDLEEFPGMLAYIIGICILGKWIAKKFVNVGSKIKNGINNEITNRNNIANANNVEVDRQIAIAEQQCNAIRNEYAQMDFSWYPPSYQTSDAARFFYKAILNSRCHTIGQAVNLYEDKLYKDESLRLQKEQVNLAFQQCILQAQTIAAIHNEGAATRNTIMRENAATRNTIMQEEVATRAANNANFADISNRLDQISRTADKIRKQL